HSKPTASTWTTWKMQADAAWRPYGSAMSGWSTMFRSGRTMILALDFGNSQLFGGVIGDDIQGLRFRKPSRPTPSSDELGLFLRAVLRENGHDPEAIAEIAMCSVVPDAIYSMRSCCRKYFGIDPFILQAGAKTGLKIRYRNP